jgi:hypothetical protein
MERDALPRYGQALGVQPGEPRWGRGGGRREVNHHAVLVEEVHDPVKPAEIVLIGAGLQLRPEEDAERDEVHVRLAHQAHVLVPDLLRPLLGVVISAV